jgi:hypothetical protein
LLLLCAKPERGLAFVVDPALRIEDRPGFKRPDKKVRWLF